MADEHVSNPKKGIPTGIKAPLFEIRDIYKNQVDLKRFFDEYDGILIDFFRGAF